MKTLHDLTRWNTRGWNTRVKLSSISTAKSLSDLTRKIVTFRERPDAVKPRKVDILIHEMLDLHPNYMTAKKLAIRCGFRGTIELYNVLRQLREKYSHRYYVECRGPVRFSELRIVEIPR